MSQFFYPEVLELLLTSFRIISFPVIIPPFPSPCIHPSVLLYLNHIDSLKIIKAACYYLNFEIKVVNFAFDERYLSFSINFQFCNTFFLQTVDKMHQKETHINGSEKLVVQEISKLCRGLYNRSIYKLRIVEITQCFVLSM